MTTAIHLLRSANKSAARGTLAAPKPLMTAVAHKVYCPQKFEPVYREGSMVFTELPSRIGDCLYYRDGRITDLQGKFL